MKKAIWIKYYEQGLLKEELTFDAAETRINLRMKELNQAGIKQGDRVIVQLSNSPSAVITYLAIYRLKAIAVPVSILENREKIDFIVSDCGANSIINEDGIRSLGSERNKIETGNISTIIYTSGTTGVPKGVCLSWDNWKANAKSLIKHHKLNNKTVFASPLLLTHCNAHGLAMITTYLAGCIWILFDKTPANILDIITKEKVEILSVVPAILYSIYNSNKNWRPHKELKYILTAAAPLSPSLLSDVLKDWKVRIVQGYGLSESTNFSCTMPINLKERFYDKIMFPWSSVGIALSGVKIKINSGNKENKVGELSVCSKSNFNGYWGKDNISLKKWVATGDIGYYKIISNKKYYYLKGRIKEIINRGGEKISPVELEHELHRLGLSGEFAVISMPDKKYGEEVGLACCNQFDFSILKSIPKYRRPKRVFLLNNLFYTHTGKLQRKKISETCNSGGVKIIMNDKEE